MSNAIAISRDLVASGLTQKQADALAEKIVTHADETVATKADLAGVKHELRADIRILTAAVATNAIISAAILAHLLSSASWHAPQLLT